jgi:general secretion pathway protein K
MTKQRGVALLGILLVVSLVTILAVSIAHSNMVRLGLTERRIETAQAWQIWQAGVEWGRDILREDARRSKHDHPGEFWARGIEDYQAEGGTLSGTMADQQSLFNLNNLARPGPVGELELETFRRLLRLLGLDESLSESLADWVDSDRALREGGAEDAYYAGMDPPYNAANRPLRHMAELYRVRGFSPGVVERLRPYVTVLPPGTTVNVNSASTELLTALLPDVDPAVVESLTQRREKTPFETLEDVRQAIPAGTAISDFRLSVNSRYFILRLAVRFGNARAEGEVLLDRITRLPGVVWRARGLSQPLGIVNPINMEEVI